jgi:hypothetical protein
MTISIGGGITIGGGISFVSGTTPTPTPPGYFDYVTALLSGSGTDNTDNNTFLDSSTNNFTVKRNGNPTQGSFGPYGGGWSNYFDGTGDFLTLSSAPVAATGTFTIECWVYVTGTAVAQSIYGQYLGNPSPAAGRWNMLWNDAANKFSFSIASTSYESTSTYSANTWYHIAWVRDGSNNLSLYVNGVRDSTRANITASLYTGNPIIGARSDGTTPYTGYISNFRVTNTVVYSGTTYTVPTGPLTAITGTTLLTCQSNRFIDNSTNNFTITRSGNVAVEKFNPFGIINNSGVPEAYTPSVYGGSAYLDGTGDYLTVATNTALDFENSDFTAECWIYPILFNASGGGFMGVGAQSGSASWILRGNSSGTLTFSAWYSPGGGADVTTITSTTGVLRFTAWNHVAVTRQGTSWNIWCNGISVASGTRSTAIANTGRPAQIGYDYSSSTVRTQNAYISDVRWVKGTAVYTSAFTPPTAPLTAITNTSLLLNGTNAGIYDSTTISDYETAGNAKISTAVSKWGTGSMYFDGTGGYLYSPNLTLNANKDYTLECWVYIAAFDAVQPSGIFFSGTGSSDLQRVQLSINPAGSVSFTMQTTAGVSNGVTSATGLITAGNWYYLTVVRDGNLVTVYVNGTSVATLTVTLSITVADTTYIGFVRSGAALRYLNGYINDFRITNGVARYTSNFTPPDAPLPAIPPVEPA